MLQRTLPRPHGCNSTKPRHIRDASHTRQSMPRKAGPYVETRPKGAQDAEPFQWRLKVSPVRKSIIFRNFFEKKFSYTLACAYTREGATRRIRPGEISSPQTPTTKGKSFSLIPLGSLSAALSLPRGGLRSLPRPHLRQRAVASIVIPVAHLGIELHQPASATGNKYHACRFLR